MTFQITDDLLDYTQTPDVTGKPSGLDLREHKVTPAPQSRPYGPRHGRSVPGVEEVFADPHPSKEQIDRIVELVREAGGPGIRETEGA